MEGNKDESTKCISIAQRCIHAEQYEKATKFLNKAERLYPTQLAKDLLEHVNLKMSSSEGDGGGGGTDTPGEGVRQRKGSIGRDKPHANGPTEPKEKDYTDDQLTAVRRIKKCKDYYEILGIEKDATEADMKKAYRKLALQMHPDKNKAPGSTEAFKAIGNAFGVLNDAGKKRKYDLYGSEEDQRQSSRGHDHDYTHGFEGDISPEDLFNMFFGGGMPSGGVRVNRGSFTHRRRQSGEDQQGGATLLLQLAPILLLVVLSLLSSFFVSDPAFSLQRSDKYSAERKTSHLHIPYYVKQDFRSNFAGDLRRMERQVEEEFVSNLRSNCWRERSYKENMLWKARNYADAKLYERAQGMETPSCDQLQKIYT